MEGEVVAVGPRVLRFYQHPAPGVNKLVNPDGVSVGDIVAFREYAGREIKLDGEEFKLLRFEELDGRIKETE